MTPELINGNTYIVVVEPTSNPSVVVDYSREGPPGTGIPTNGSIGQILVSTGGANSEWTNSNIVANLTGYVTTTNLTNNLANYITTNDFNTTLANYQQESGLSANVATLTANNVSYVGSVSAANVVSNAQLSANLSNYVNTTHLSNNLSNYALLSAATFTGNVIANNANTTYDLNVGRNLTVTGNLTVSGNVTVIGANNLSIVDNMIYLNSNSTTANPDLGIAGNYNDGTYHHAGFFRDASDGIWKVFDNYLPEPDANVNIDTSNTTFHIANFQANIVYIGNTSVYSTVNTTNFTGTSNNTLYVGSITAANVVSNAQLTANLANYLVTNTAINTGNVTVNGNITLTGNISGNTAGFAIGYRDIPQNFTNTSFSLALTDAGKHILTQNSGSSTQTITVPNNSSVAFSTGAAISIVVQSTGTVAVANGVGVTMYLAGNSTAKSTITLNSYSMATVMKIGTDTWIVSGTGAS